MEKLEQKYWQKAGKSENVDYNPWFMCSFSECWRMYALCQEPCSELLLRSPQVKGSRQDRKPSLEDIVANAH
jgi:hypothetical protein